MAFAKKKNNAKTTIDMTGGINSSNITLVVTDGSVFPDTGYFYITIWDKSTYTDPGNDSSMEIVKCTNRNGDILTIVRAQDGTVAHSHNNGDAVELLLTKAILDEYEDQFIINTSDIDISSNSFKGASFYIKDINGDDFARMRIDGSEVVLEIYNNSSWNFIQGWSL